jgi:hypothetical protein
VQIFSLSRLFVEKIICSAGMSESDRDDISSADQVQNNKNLTLRLSVPSVPTQSSSFQVASSVNLPQQPPPGYEKISSLSSTIRNLLSPEWKVHEIFFRSIDYYSIQGRHHGALCRYCHRELKGRVKSLISHVKSCQMIPSDIKESFWEQTATAEKSKVCSILKYSFLMFLISLFFLFLFSVFCFLNLLFSNHNN